MFKNRNVIVLDLETARSADDCRHCGEPKGRHGIGNSCHQNIETLYEPIGWTNKPALGLSIGGYYSYADDRVYWFDKHNLEGVVHKLVNEQPLMVSFNGIQFDFPLMRGILRHRADAERKKDRIPEFLRAEELSNLCDAFKTLAAQSYDLLYEIWKADPDRKFKKDLNSLDSIAQANGLGAKIGRGALVPRDWADGRYADVINYCSWDIENTRRLFEMIAKGDPILRSDGSSVQLPGPVERGAAPTGLPF